uniref:U25-Liphistoxin-Lth1a_1 n=1 Tax=Liphistius thaleban TaxID=1905330 RepID=A0A4Q8K6N1_9ARAC
MPRAFLFIVYVSAVWILPDSAEGALEDLCLRNGFGKCSTAKLCEREKLGVAHHKLCPMEGVFPEQLICCEKVKSNVGDCRRVGGLCMTWCAAGSHYVDSRCPDRTVDCLHPRGNCTYCCRFIL